MPRAKKDNRGGPRQGTPGVSYPNRSDMRQPKVPVQGYTGGAYGSRVRQEEAQRAVPMAAPPPTPGQAAPVQAAVAAGPPPGGLGSLLDPTARPDEPLTAGLSTGPGPGPEVLSARGDPDADYLRAIYRAHPTAALRSILAAMEEQP